MLGFSARLNLRVGSVLSVFWCVVPCCWFVNAGWGVAVVFRCCVD